MPAQVKDPSSVIDWTHDWADYLQSSETISSSTWSVTPTTTSPLTVDSDTETTTTATVWLSGGLVGQVYRVTNQIVTNQSRTEQRDLVIRCENQ